MLVSLSIQRVKIFHSFQSLSVHGEFIDSSSKNVTVDLGKPFRLHCPKHTAGFGTEYIWVKPSNIHFSRNEGRGISPNGTLFIANLTQKDIDEVNDGGIVCRIKAGSTFEDSGKLSLEKNPLQKGREQARTFVHLADEW